MLANEIDPGRDRASFVNSQAGRSDADWSQRFCRFEIVFGADEHRRNKTRGVEIVAGSPMGGLFLFSRCDDLARTVPLPDSFPITSDFDWRSGCESGDNVRTFKHKLLPGRFDSDSPA